jgi:hypothetical protein
LTEVLAAPTPVVPVVAVEFADVELAAAAEAVEEEFEVVVVVVVEEDRV